MGAPFAGNLIVYPVYRTSVGAGCAENRAKPGRGSSALYSGPTILRNVLLRPVNGEGRAAHCPTGASEAKGELLNVSGRKVLDLHPGANDVRALPTGVYFVRMAQAQAVRKVVLTE